MIGICVVHWNLITILLVILLYCKMHIPYNVKLTSVYILSYVKLVRTNKYWQRWEAYLVFSPPKIRKNGKSNGLVWIKTYRSLILSVAYQENYFCFIKRFIIKLLIYARELSNHYIELPIISFSIIIYIYTWIIIFNNYIWINKFLSLNSIIFSLFNF